MRFRALAVRNLLRNRWRSALTAGGVAVAVALMVWTFGLMEGYLQTMLRGATAVELGQVQVHTAAYADEARSYRAFDVDESLLRTVADAADVDAVSPRVELHGLIGTERRSQVARLLGVDPARERRATPVTDGLRAGRWLADSPPAYPAPREAVLGTALARQLGVGLGDELVVFLEASDGSLGNDVVEVVGIVETGSPAIDRRTAYVHLADAQYLGALEGRAHELAIRTVRGADATAVAAAVERALAAAGEDVAGGSASGADGEGADATADGGPATNEAGAGEALVVRAWPELLPDIAKIIDLSRRSTGSMYFLVYLVAAVGILNTQRMSALERRREFGVMIAIGVTPRRLFRLVMGETVVLGLVGSIVGATLGWAVAAYHASAGLDLTMISDAGFTFMNVAFSDRLYFEVRPIAVIQPVLVMLVAAVLSGLVPALRSAKTDPAPAIAGRT